MSGSPGHIEGKYRPFTEKRLSELRGKLCTMFAFDGVDDPNLLHCTHKYFGEGKASAAEIIHRLEAYFAQHPFQIFRVKFGQIDQFGEDKDYRVVRPESSEPFMLKLKGMLDELEADTYPEYKPHVTVGRNTDEVDMPIRDYVLMHDGVQIWSAMEFAYRLEAECRGRLSLPGAGKAGNEFSRRRLEGPSISGTFEDHPWKRDIKGPKAV